MKKSLFSIIIVLIFLILFIYVLNNFLIKEPYNETKEKCKDYCGGIIGFDYNFRYAYSRFNESSNFIDCVCIIESGDSDYVKNLQEKYEIILGTKILYLDHQTLKIMGEKNIFLDTKTFEVINESNMSSPQE